MKKLVKIKMMLLVVFALSIGMLAASLMIATSFTGPSFSVGERQTTVMIGDYFIHPKLNFYDDFFNAIEIRIFKPDGSPVIDSNANKTFLLSDWIVWAADSRKTDFQFDRAGNFIVEVIARETESGLSQTHSYVIMVASQVQIPPPAQGDARFDDGLRLHFIDVGQGDAAVIELPSGQIIMIDSGGGNQAHIQNRVYQIVYNYLTTYIFQGDADRVIDLFIATHSHADHIGTFDQLMQDFEIRHIVRPKTFTQSEIDNRIPENMFDLTGPFVVHNTQVFQRVVTQMALQQYNFDTLITVPYRNKTIDIFDCVDIRFYSPTRVRYTASGINNLSTIFSVYFQGRRMLFTGDAYVSSENNILAIGDDGRTGFGTLPDQIYQVDILDVGHHGSNTSTGLAFLQKIQPRYSIIQVGMPNCTRANPNGYGHPHQPVLNNLRQVNTTVLMTKQVGNILARISICGTYIDVSGQRNPPTGECCGDSLCECDDWFGNCYYECECWDWCEHADCDCIYCYGNCGCWDWCGDCCCECDYWHGYCYYECECWDWCGDDWCDCGCHYFYYCDCYLYDCECLDCGWYCNCYWYGWCGDPWCDCGQSQTNCIIACGNISTFWAGGGSVMLLFIIMVLGITMAIVLARKKRRG
ncbi:MAG: MBL fold metallo-hydrolase [Firmicutes bacterium]|nr:MBL fold metallo-hydrolase [Bacillota bacterium]